MKRRAALLLLFLALPSMASGRWRVAESEHFIVYSEQGAETLKAFATKLERYDKGIRTLNSLPPSEGGKANRLVVFIASVDDIQKIYSQNLPGPQRRSIGGFYAPHAGGSIAFVARTRQSYGWDARGETILFHEYAHHIMLENSSAAYPAWYIEGFAEFNSTARIMDDGSAGFGYPATHRIPGLVEGKPLKLAAMMGTLPEKMSAKQIEALYGRGWLLTHYLTFSKPRAGQLRRYLAALNSGKSGLQAAEQAFGDLDLLDRELDGYFAQAQISYLPMPASVLAIGEVTVREISNGEDAILPIRMRSQAGVNRKTATEVLADARRVAARYPKDPAVQIALAEAEFDAGNDAEADAAADRVLAADPKHVRAMIYKSMVAMRRAAKDPEQPDLAGIARARDWAVSANRADPDDPVPLLHFYNSFRAAKRPPSDSAVAGLRRAFELAPQDFGLRMTLARQRLSEAKTAEARQLLGPVAFSPHGGKAAEHLRTIIERIDAGETAGLVDLLDKGPPEDEAAKG